MTSNARPTPDRSMRPWPRRHMRLILSAALLPVAALGACSSPERELPRAPGPSYAADDLLCGVVPASRVSAYLEVPIEALRVDSHRTDASLFCAINASPYVSNDEVMLVAKWAPTMSSSDKQLQENPGPDMKPLPDDIAASGRFRESFSTFKVVCKKEPAYGSVGLTGGSGDPQLILDLTRFLVKESAKLPACVEG